MNHKFDFAKKCAVLSAIRDIYALFITSNILWTSTYLKITYSLHSTSPLDMSIKGQMVRDLLNISGYKIPDNLLNTAMRYDDKNESTLIYHDLYYLRSKFVFRSNSFNNPSSLDKGRFALTSDQKAKVCKVRTIYSQREQAIFIIP